MPTSSLDTELSPAEAAFRDEVRSLLEQQSTFERVRALEAGPPGYDAALWSTFAQRGWTRVVGATGGGVEAIRLALLHVELGRTLCPSPHLWSAVGAAHLLAGATGAGALVEDVVAGRAVATVAFGERGRNRWIDGWSSALLHTERGGELTGEKRHVAWAESCDWLIVGTGTGDDRALCAVRRDAPGVMVAPVRTMSKERLATVRFAGAPVEPGHVLRCSRSEIVARLLPLVLARSAQSAGAAERVVELAAEYARHRVAFGRPIGSFQALQHYLADALSEATAALALVHYAAWAVEQDPALALRLVPAAKLVTSEVMMNAALVGTQVHGGAGYSEETPMPLFVRRAMAWRASLGGDALWEDELARALDML
jgi:acyl-CoA dehydrogenase